MCFVHDWLAPLQPHDMNLAGCAIATTLHALHTLICGWCCVQWCPITQVAVDAVESGAAENDAREAANSHGGVGVKHPFAVAC